MLRSALLVFALALALASAAAWRAGWPQALPLTFYASVLAVAVVFERWRYRGPSGKQRRADWQETGERFLDPVSGKLVRVEYNSRTGERRYLGSKPAD